MRSCTAAWDTASSITEQSFCCPRGVKQSEPAQILGGYLSKEGVSRNCHSSKNSTTPKAWFMATSSKKTFLSTPISHGSLSPGNFSDTFIWHLLTPCPILLCNGPVCVDDFLNHRYHKLLSKDETSLFHSCRTHETCFTCVSSSPSLFFLYIPPSCLPPSGGNLYTWLRTWVLGPKRLVLDSYQLCDLRQVASVSVSSSEQWKLSWVVNDWTHVSL